jgi:hypothetical protein
MAQFKAFTPGMEVVGGGVLSIIEGMGEFRSMAEAILAQHGLKKIQPDGWYSQQAFLDAFKTIAEKIGPRTLFACGKQILATIEWPPELDNLEAGLRSIDVLYHRSHRLNNVSMFDEKTGECRPGLGHYTLESLGKSSGVMVCPNPYPSEFDRGIITAMGRRFKPDFEARLDSTKPTRLKGADSCTYILEWRT